MAKPSFTITITKLNPATNVASLEKENDLFDVKRCSVAVGAKGMAALEKVGVGQDLDDELAIIINNKFGELFFTKDYQTGEYK